MNSRVFIPVFAGTKM